MTTSIHKMNELLYGFLKIILCRMKISGVCNGEGTNMLICLNVTHHYFCAIIERCMLREAVMSVVKSTSCKHLFFLFQSGRLACLCNKI